MFLLECSDGRIGIRPPLDETAHHDGTVAGRPFQILARQPGRLQFVASARFVLAINGYIDAISLDDAAIPVEQRLLALLRRCEAHGTEALDGLQGSYSLCLIDRLRNSIALQRDPLGGRSGFVYEDDHRLILSSHAAPIARHPAVEFRENPDYLARRLAYAGFPDATCSPFANIQALEPGQRWQWPAGDRQVSRCAVAVPQRFSDPGEQAVEQGFLHRLNNAIAGCTGTHARTASLLSGGLDSAPATALLHRQMRGRDRELQIVSWALPDHEASDERCWIDATASHLGLEPEYFDGADCMPYARIAIDQINPDWMEYNAFRELLQGCFRGARDLGVEAVINCTAGDFLYPLHLHLTAGYWRNGDRAALQALLVGRVRHWRSGQCRPWHDPVARFMLRTMLTGPRARLTALSRYRRRLLTSDLRSQLPTPPTLPTGALQHPVPDYPAFALRALACNRAMESWFAEDFGLHYHDPYQNQALMEFMLGLPFTYSHRRGRSKWVMHRIARGLIPESVRTKRRTGNLFPFLLAGYRRHRKDVRERILDTRGWQHLLDPVAVENLLASENPREADIVLFNQLLGYSLWREYWSGSRV